MTLSLPMPARITWPDPRIDAVRVQVTVIACAMGFVIGNGLMVFFGSVSALASDEGDFTTLLLGMGMIS